MACTQSFSLIKDNYFVKIPKLYDQQSLIEYEIAQVLSKTKYSKHILEINDVYHYELPHNFRDYTNVLEFYDIKSQNFLINNKHLDVPCTRWTIQNEPLLLSTVVKHHKEFPTRVLASLYCQSILLLLALQYEVGFIHGDFHTGNVFVEKTDLEEVTFEVCLNEKVTIKTFGYTIKMFDFGRSALFKNTPPIMSPAWSAIDDNYVYWRFDELFDISKFVDCVKSELDEYRTSILNNLIQQLYRVFSGYCDALVDFNESGLLCVAEECLEYLENHQKPNFFNCGDSDDEEYCGGGVDDYIYDLKSVKNPKVRLDFDEFVGLFFQTKHNFETELEKVMPDSVGDDGSTLTIFRKFYRGWEHVENFLSVTTYYTCLYKFLKFVSECNDDSADFVKQEAEFFCIVNETLQSINSNNKSLLINRQQTDIVFHGLKALQNALFTELRADLEIKDEQLQSIKNKIKKSIHSTLHPEKLNIDCKDISIPSQLAIILKQLLKYAENDVVEKHLNINQNE